MRMLSTLAILAVAMMPIAVSAQTAPAPAAPAAPEHYTTAKTGIGTLIGDPAAKAILMKIIPEIAGNEGIAAAGSMTLKDIQPRTGGLITDAQLSEIDYELAKLPAK